MVALLPALEDWCSKKPAHIFCIGHMAKLLIPTQNQGTCRVRCVCCWMLLRNCRACYPFGGWVDLALPPDLILQWSCADRGRCGDIGLGLRGEKPEITVWPMAVIRFADPYICQQQAHHCMDTGRMGRLAVGCFCVIAGHAIPLVSGNTWHCLQTWSCNGLGLIGAGGRHWAWPWGLEATDAVGCGCILLLAPTVANSWLSQKYEVRKGPFGIAACSL